MFIAKNNTNAEDKTSSAKMSLVQILILYVATCLEHLPALADLAWAVAAPEDERVVSASL